jgi:glucose/mannose-6-phosphate isomerase
MSNHTAAELSGDPQGMLDLVLRLPSLCRQGWELGAEVSLPATPPSTIIAIGMGGSGIGGALLRTLLFDEATLPVAVVKEYRVPAFVDGRTLAFVCSYSGNTEETLAAYDDAARRGATCVVTTSGGILLERARERGDQVVILPPGVPQRAALPYLFLPMVSALSRNGIIRALDGDVAEAVDVLTRVVGEHGPSRPAGRAAQLADAFLHRIPVIYSATPFLEPAAERWKDQINENAKTFAVWNTYPELTHNETVGWGMDESLAQQLAVVILHDPRESDRLRQRVQITRDLALRKAGFFDEVSAIGDGKLARLLSIIAIGDLASVYLALLRKVDPTPVPVIEELKKRLAER